jgi:hypothetical protein
VKNETLNATVKSMHEELVRVRKDYAESMQILEAKWKEERK